MSPISEKMRAISELLITASPERVAARGRGIGPILGNATSRDLAAAPGS
jgi:hypothetical protein